MSIPNYGAIETHDSLTRSLGFFPAQGAKTVLNPALQWLGNTWNRGVLHFYTLLPGLEG